MAAMPRSKGVVTIRRCNRPAIMLKPNGEVRFFVGVPGINRKAKGAMDRGLDNVGATFQKIMRMTSYARIGWGRASPQFPRSTPGQGPNGPIPDARTPGPQR